MHYEMLNVIDPESPIWQQVAARAKSSQSKILGLAASPHFARYVADAGLKGISVVDHVTGHRYDLNKHIFFNDVPVPDMASVSMYPDGSIFVMQNGKPIAREFVLPNSRRVPQDVRYTNILDGSMDYVEEYGPDGSIYSNIFYWRNDLQEIDFYNTKGAPVLRYYYYDNLANFVTIEDPKTHTVTAQYDTMNEFLQDQLAKILKPTDSVTFNFMGLELDALAHTQSHNILRMMESPFDETGNVRGNLVAILNNDIPWVQEVQMPLPDFQRLSATGLPMDKVKLAN